MTITKCDKCGTYLRVNRGVIKIIYPVFTHDGFVIFNLCRGCFIEGDDLNSSDFILWIHEGK